MGQQRSQGSCQTRHHVGAWHIITIAAAAAAGRAVGEVEWQNPHGPVTVTTNNLHTAPPQMSLNTQTLVWEGSGQDRGGGEGGKTGGMGC